MANPAHLHLMNHVPLLGTAFGLGLVGWALLRKSEELKKISLSLIVSALMARTANLGGLIRHTEIRSDVHATMVNEEKPD